MKGCSKCSHGKKPAKKALPKRGQRTIKSKSRKK